jgi:hypothetical protein
VGVEARVSSGTPGGIAWPHHVEHGTQPHKTTSSSREKSGGGNHGITPGYRYTTLARRRGWPEAEGILLSALVCDWIEVVDSSLYVHCEEAARVRRVSILVGTAPTPQTMPMAPTHQGRPGRHADYPCLPLLQRGSPDARSSRRGTVDPRRPPGWPDRASPHSGGQYRHSPAS